ncbi:MAG: aromatic ring-hydroxylating dioxygenase subunit alpha [Acidobacteria bacterium]|nr:aromatic ring-hydroxylating dioxygenase subunit alpha [Acidobacteriota bacterium]
MFQKTAESYRQGARTLAREAYTSGEIFAFEQERIFARHWNCVGRASRLARAGDYIVRSVAGESIVVVRGQDGRIRAFFNVCRHRGTRLCSEEAGRFDRVIQCPYHAWTYTTEGALVGAPHMHDVEGFDRADYPLHVAEVAEHDGFVFVNMASPPPPFAKWFAPLADRFRRFGLAALEVGHRADYDVQANWKLVFENYSECLHCLVIHPELASRLPYESGANDLVEGPFLGGYMIIADPHESVTVTGRVCGLPISADLTADDRRRAYYYSVMPNLLVSIHPDYVNYYLLTPLGPGRTRVESEWLFRKPSFNPSDAIAFWDLVNRQDWHIIEQSQQGIASRRYVPGPYSPRESISAAWDREYLRLMNEVEK